MNFVRQGFRKLSPDRQTDRQTPSKLYTTSLRGWSKSSDRKCPRLLLAFTYWKQFSYNIHSNSNNKLYWHRTSRSCFPLCFRNVSLFVGGIVSANVIIVNYDFNAYDCSPVCRWFAERIVNECSCAWKLTSLVVSWNSWPRPRCVTLNKFRIFML